MTGIAYDVRRSMLDDHRRDIEARTPRPVAAGCGHPSQILWHRAGSSPVNDPVCTACFFDGTGR